MQPNPFQPQSGPKEFSMIQDCFSSTVVHPMSLTACQQGKRLVPGVTLKCPPLQTRKSLQMGMVMTRGPLEMIQFLILSIELTTQYSSALCFIQEGHFFFIYQQIDQFFYLAMSMSRGKHSSYKKLFTLEKSRARLTYPPLHCEFTFFRSHINSGIAEKRTGFLFCWQQRSAAALEVAIAYPDEQLPIQTIQEVHQGYFYLKLQWSKNQFYVDDWHRQSCLL